MTTASASGKIILFGEHAVVYGRPAIAVPLAGLRTRVRVEPAAGRHVTIHALDLGRTLTLAEAPADDPLARIVRSTLARIGAGTGTGLDIVIESDIPPASGMGSGAAVSTALVRALAAHFGFPIEPSEVSALVYETEKLYHGTPSGIDNTVIAFERPILFTRGEGGRPFKIARPFKLLIAHTGISSPTRITVGDVRRGWGNKPARYEAIFDQVGEIVENARAALASGANDELGPLMKENQELLRLLGVTSAEIENLIRAAEEAGAVGGKLSGGGRGGNVIVYAGEGEIGRVERALVNAGAAKVLVTTIG